MKKYICLILMVALTSIAARAEIGKRYDRFKKQTTVMTKPGDLPNRPGLSLMATYPGENLMTAIASVNVTFVSKSESWEYLSCNGTDLLIDGNPYNPGTATHDGSAHSGFVLEFISFTIPFTEIQNWALAQKIEVKICNTEFTLAPGEMNDLKEFVRLLTPAK